MIRFFKYSVFFLLGLILVVGPVVDRIAKAKLYEPLRKHYDEQLAKIKPKFREDLLLLEKAELFPEFGRHHNAEELLGQHVPWSGDGTHEAVGATSKKAVEFMSKYNSWQMNSDLVAQILKDKDLMQIDVAWLDGVTKYDHWDISTNPQTAPQLQRALQLSGLSKVGLFASLPIPDYNSLRRASQVRLFQKYKKGETLEGLKVFRKTNELIYSSGLLVGTLYSAMLFNDERAFVENLQVKSWTTVPAEATLALKRSAWAWVGILRGTIFRDIPEDIKPYVKVQNGICAASWEGSLTGFLQDYLAFEFPFESDHSEDVDRLVANTSRFLSQCHLQKYEVFNTRTPASENHIILDQSFSLSGVYELGIFDRLNLSRVPYARRVFGYSLLSVGYPSYFKMYSED